jgi:hypothetical protein
MANLPDLQYAIFFLDRPEARRLPQRIEMHQRLPLWVYRRPTKNNPDCWRSIAISPDYNGYPFRFARHSPQTTGQLHALPQTLRKFA